MPGRLALAEPALVAAGAVDAGTADQIRADLELAVAVRQPGQQSQASAGQRGLSPDARKQLAGLVHNPSGRASTVAFYFPGLAAAHPAPGAAPGTVAGSAGRPGDPDPGRRRPPPSGWDHLADRPLPAAVQYAGGWCRGEAGEVERRGPAARRVIRRPGQLLPRVRRAPADPRSAWLCWPGWRTATASSRSARI